MDGKMDEGMNGWVYSMSNVFFTFHISGLGERGDEILAGNFIGLECNETKINSIRVIKMNLNLK